jgi:hypothetical protein
MNTERAGRLKRLEIPCHRVEQSGSSTAAVIGIVRDIGAHRLYLARQTEFVFQQYRMYLVPKVRIETEPLLFRERVKGVGSLSQRWVCCCASPES